MGSQVDPGIALRLTQARESAGMTQAELGRLLSVTQQTVSRWEAGTQSMVATQIRDACRELGVTSDFLLFGTCQHPECPPAGRPDCSFIKIYRGKATDSGWARLGRG